MRNLILVLFAMTYASVVNASPVAESGSETLCVDYNEVFEGVWFDGEREVLLWRLGRTGRQGCYAWLNGYARWDVDRAGGWITNVRRSGRNLVLNFGEERLVLYPNFTAEYFIDDFITKGIYRQTK